MGNGGSRNLLRPEAGPVPFEKLQRRAQDALNRIIPALCETAAMAKVAEPEGGGEAQTRSDIDTNRVSRLFFVSGEPGSGKSTVYLTLRAMTSNEGRFKDHGKHYNNQNGLDALKKAVRWLEPLDLEVAGDERDNLLAAVLVRLFDALERSAGILSKPCEAAIKDLEELATDIGIAWEGNLQKRAGALDPATYSEEVMLAQRARLGVNNRLKRALNKLAESRCGGCDKETLFVLPVEDFYLKPDASLQLLRLLRMVSVPRLFFLLMGDIKTVEALFTEKSLADWTAVAGARTFTDPRNDRLKDALSRARELRARYLRKLLPPGQRAEIEAMDWDEALDLEVGRPKSNADAAETLEEILVKVRLDVSHNSNDEPDPLLTFLISPSLPSLNSERGKEEKQKRVRRAKGDKDAEESKEEIALKKARAAYTALQILDATPREIMDLGSELGEVIRRRQQQGSWKTDENPAPLLLLCIKDIVRLVSEEQSFLNEKEQEVLEGILPTRHYSPDDISFAMNRLCLRPSLRTGPETSNQLRVRKHRSWDLHVNKKFIGDSMNEVTKSDDNKSVERDVKDPYSKLPPRPAAWFVLLHDLAWEWKPESVTGNLVKKLCEDLDKWQLRKAEIEKFVNQSKTTQKENHEEPNQQPDPLDDWEGWAVWYDKAPGTYKHFAMPEFETFRDIDRFLHIWTRGLERLEKRGELQKADANKIASVWALAGWTVLAGAYENFALGGDKWFEEFEKTTGTTGGTVKARLETFKKTLSKKKPRRSRKSLETQKAFKYPSDKDAEIRKWLERKGKWPE